MIKILLLTLLCASFGNFVNVIQPRPRFEENVTFSTSRIVGGFETDIETYPYQISLQYRGSHMCGGSLISPKFILTAAHCTYGRTAASLRVRVGSSKHASGGIVITVTRITQHPSFDYSTIDYDFSILELSISIQRDATRQPVILPEQNEALEDDTLCIVSGWGITQNPSDSNTFLRAAYVPSVSQSICNKAYSMYGGVSERMLCAGFRSGGKDACQGDSGGPLVANEKLVGVVSWGFGCGKPNYPGVYSRVATVREWISMNTGV